MRIISMFLILTWGFVLTSCNETKENTNYGDSDPITNGSIKMGDIHEGQYHLGPVDFIESEWHNACAPGGGYRDELVEVTGLGGEFIAGVSNVYKLDGGICDACIFIQTEAGKSIVARVLTYGVTNEAWGY